MYLAFTETERRMDSSQQLAPAKKYSYEEGRAGDSTSLNQTLYLTTKAYNNDTTLHWPQ